VALVKGKYHAPGEKRPVAPARFQYPRYSIFTSSLFSYACYCCRHYNQCAACGCGLLELLVGLDRGETYFPENVIDKQVFPWQPTEAIEYIPQVQQTYNFLDGSYALINENQVGYDIICPCLSLVH
jgi:hypothetical protein